MRTKIHAFEQGKTMGGRSPYTSGFSAFGFTERGELIDYIENKLGYEHGGKYFNDGEEASKMGPWQKDAKNGASLRNIHILNFIRATGEEVFYYRVQTVAR